MKTSTKATTVPVWLGIRDSSPSSWLSGGGVDGGDMAQQPSHWLRATETRRYALQLIACQRQERTTCDRASRGRIAWQVTSRGRWWGAGGDGGKGEAEAKVARVSVKHGRTRCSYWVLAWVRQDRFQATRLNCTRRSSTACNRFVRQAPRSVQSVLCRQRLAQLGIHRCAEQFIIGLS